MTSLASAWSEVVRTPLFGVTLTVAAYVVAVRVWRRLGRTPLLTPVLVAIGLVVAFLEVTGVRYDDYMQGGRYLSFLLGPATVALAVPLHRAASSIRRLLLPVAVGTVVGAATAMSVAVLAVRLLGGSHELEATLAPKSATTPIAIVLSSGAGGIASLTAVLTVVTGVMGAVLGPWLLGLVRVRDPRIRGLALGVSSHGIGTSRGLQEGPVTGAFAALAMALSGVLTSLLMPAVLALAG